MMAGLRSADAAGEGEDADGWKLAVEMMDEDSVFFTQIHDEVNEDMGSLRADP